MMVKLLITLFVGLSIPLSCKTNSGMQTNESSNGAVTAPYIEQAGEVSAYFASGCFWCVEAIFESVKGVSEVISGYAGGTEADANYSQVSRGVTKHVEAVRVIYDPEIISYETLVIVFYGSHDPTTLNRQGPDRGYQYRSEIYYQNESEKEIANKITEELIEAKVYDNPIVTDIIPYKNFFDAEPYHQDFERKNPNQGYVRAVSVPRLNRFKAKFPELLKESVH